MGKTPKVVCLLDRSTNSNNINNTFDQDTRSFAAQGECHLYLDTASKTGSQLNICEPRCGDLVKGTAGAISVHCALDQHSVAIHTDPDGDQYRVGGCVCDDSPTSTGPNSNSKAHGVEKRSPRGGGGGGGGRGGKRSSKSSGGSSSKGSSGGSKGNSGNSGSSKPAPAPGSSRGKSSTPSKSDTSAPKNDDPAPALPPPKKEKKKDRGSKASSVPVPTVQKDNQKASSGTTDRKQGGNGPPDHPSEPRESASLSSGQHQASSTQPSYTLGDDSTPTDQPLAASV
ncbi:MAG: hypothetical protein Q9218_006432 [Villophora microphyllina]